MDSDSMSSKSSSTSTIRFYDPSIKATDAHGRTLNQILKWDDKHLEVSHNYIQVLFPIPEGSMFNYGAPVINSTDFDAFRSRPELQDRMREAFNRMLQFYGFMIEEESRAATENKTAQGNKEVDGNPEAANEASEEEFNDQEGATVSKEKVVSRADPEQTSAPSLTSPASPVRIVRAPKWPIKFRNWAMPLSHNHLRITRILRSLRVLGLKEECEAFFNALEEVFNDPDIPISAKSMTFWTRAVEEPLYIAPDGTNVNWLKDRQE